MLDTNSKFSRNKYFSSDLFDRGLALFIGVSLAPVWIFNLAIASIKQENIIRHSVCIDALGRKCIVKSWSCGVFPLSYVFFQIILGELALCGISIRKKSNLRCDQMISSELKPGIFSVADLHATLGYIEMSLLQSVVYHEERRSAAFHLSLLVKSLFANIAYGNKSLKTPPKFTLFGIKVNNVSFDQAVNWICNVRANRCRITYFVNVNSVNLAEKSKSFKAVLNSADCVLADGSGIRVGARRIGVQLKDNVNGTDLLPYLCTKLSLTGQSVFLLGAAPGVAKRTANRLIKDYPRLKIAGSHHGYFEGHESSKVIKEINDSKADVVLVALGSPYQEEWLAQYKSWINSDCALAIGGLFDFYSGSIPRAPRWMRELGMEWIYRLMQEPRGKFERYVIGNPLYLFRLYFKKLVSS